MLRNSIESSEMLRANDAMILLNNGDKVKCIYSDMMNCIYTYPYQHP